MGFIIRSAFWLSLVLLLVPFGGGDDGETTVGPIDAFIAARGAIGDISGMCERQPEVCAIGKSAIHTIGVRARAGANYAIAALDDANGEAKDTPDQELTTGSVASSE